jgi:Enoyl-CoA hydratase/carnithine racemase
MTSAMPPESAASRAKHDDASDTDEFALQLSARSGPGLMEGIDIRAAEGVMTIVIDRPESRNGLTVEHMRYIGDVCTWAEDIDFVRCIVITGSNGVFCSGADLAGMDVSAPLGTPPVTVRSADLYGPLLDLSKPTIAAVNGGAAGGGLGLALSCDVRIASEQAKFATAFSRIGVPANDAVPWLLPRTVGLSRALELIYDTRAVDASEAAAIGLVSRVVPDDQLDAEVAELAGRFAAAPPYAVRFSKRLVLDGQSRSYRDFVMMQDYAQLANQTAASHDVVEGVDAFLEKRSPRFVGPTADRSERGR